MPLWQRSASRFVAALDLVADRSTPVHDILARIADSPFPSADVAAALLGHDLWYEPLRIYRDYLQNVDAERPHLWGFTFGPSAAWNRATWLSLSARTRVARARIASVAHQVDFAMAPSIVNLHRRDLQASLRELCANGLAKEIRDGAYRVLPIAPREALALDLHLIEILSHWFRMLKHADRIAADRKPSGYEVSGYEQACGFCRESWGIRAREPKWIPPFHPGCRCLAQPRFAWGSATTLQSPRRQAR